MAGNGVCDAFSKQLCPDVQITVRIKDCPESRKPIIFEVPQNPQVLKLHDDSFTFDHIKWGNESQERVYKIAGYPFVDKALQGHSATILAYGPTGTGKSYTMGSLMSMMNNWQNSGLIQRCLKHIFEEKKIQVSASFIEIYDKEVHDLLNMGAIVNRGLGIESKIEEIKSLEEGLQLVNKALEVRQEQQNSSSSLQNITSSKSHALLTLHLKIQDRDKLLESKLNLVDLAGSRIVAQTGSAERYVYGGRSYLDESLSALDKVIIGAPNKSDQMLFHKDSTLASVLQDFLDPKCLVSLVVCVSSDPASDYTATVKTLQMAKNIKAIQIQQCIELSQASSINEPKQKSDKLPVPSSEKCENIEIINTRNQAQGPKMVPCIGGTIKDCMVVLNKSDIDFIGNEKGLEFKEDMEPLKYNEEDIRNCKIPFVNFEAGCSVETESTLSISGSKLQTQNADQETFTKTDLCNTQYSDYSTCFDDSLSTSTLRDMAAVNPAKLDTAIDDDQSDHENLLGWIFPKELPLMLQPRSSLEKKQCILVDNVSQLSISGQETIMPECTNEKQGSSKSESATSDDQQLFGTAEVSHPSIYRVNKMKRMKAILTTDFSEPGPSQIHYQTPNKMMKLDMKIPKVKLERVPDPRPEPEEILVDENQCNNIENEERELNDKQRAHNNNILRIINTCTIEELTDLPRVGLKTAVSIYQYRLIHGDFKSIQDLANLPFWTEKVCNNFLAANNVILE